MKFTDSLRKLGIFRSGSLSATYTSGKNRPTEFLMDGVFNAKKDMSGSDDLKNIRKIIFWVLLVIGAVFLLVFLAKGFSLAFFVTLLLWLLFMLLVYRFAFFGAFSLVLLATGLVIVSIFSFTLFPSGPSKQSTAELMKYDKTVYDLYALNGKFKGTAGITVENGSLLVMYHILVNDPMIKNGTCNNDPCAGGPMGYNYLGNLLTPKSSEKNDPVGAYSPIYCNKDVAVTDYFEFDTGTHNCPGAVTTGTDTETFAANFSNRYYSIEEFLAANTYEVFDGSKAWVQEDANTWADKDDLAVSQGNKVKSYPFTITPR